MDFIWSAGIKKVTKVFLLYYSSEPIVDQMHCYFSKGDETVFSASQSYLNKEHILIYYGANIP